jgi:hypothetical protein
MQRNNTREENTVTNKRPTETTNGGSDRGAEQYTVFFPRTKRNENIAYEIVLDADGNFAARRLDTGYIIAGYDTSSPELSIEEAARKVYRSENGLRRIYVRGVFSDVMRRIIQEYYQCESAVAQIKNWEPARFPEGRIRLDV